MDRLKWMKKELVEPLLLWFAENQRPLPWRKNRNPYEIWVSEIMLQQTRVEAVIGYYTRFLKELPDVRALAECDEDRLMKLWEGLGYYSRVRNLNKGAKKVVEEYGGELPNSKSELLKINGIGNYTAAAIASQAFEEPVAAVDGNVLRVYSRFFEDGRDIGKEKTKKEIQQELDNLMPQGRSGDFNQAMMELGATVCVPNGAPKCEMCPIRENCCGYKNHSWQRYPVKEKKQKRRTEKRTVLLIYKEQTVLIKKRGKNGLLAGLFEFPNLEGHMAEDEVLAYVKELGMTPLHIKKLAEAKHIFSHIEWEMIGYRVRIDETQFCPKEHLFVKKAQLDEEFSIPSAFKVYREFFME